MKQAMFSSFIVLNATLLLAQANPVFNEVLYDPIGNNAGNQRIEIKNVGDATADIGGWWFCRRFTYTRLPAGVTIPPGGIIVIHVGEAGTDTPTEIFLANMASLNANNSDLCLYITSGFSNQ